MSSSKPLHELALPCGNCPVGPVPRPSAKWSRPYDVSGGYAEAPWSYKFSDHREVGGMWIPSAAIAMFERSDGPWEYFRCSVTSVVSSATPV